MKGGLKEGIKRDEKGIEMYYVHVATPCKECNHNVMQTYTSKK